MIKPVLYNELGRAQFGWLDARHHFSFGEYYNPKRMGFGPLRVINDDVIKAGTGFNTHPHDNMEIITYVRRGAITHKDSNGNEGRTEAGDVQVMSAGTGIYHSEHNLEAVDTNLYQIWIEPNQRDVTPRWDSAKFPKQSLPKQELTQQVEQGLSLLVSGNGQAPLYIHADASIYAGTIKKGASVSQALSGSGYLLVSGGQIEVDEFIFNQGDAAEILKQKQVSISALQDSEILLIDLEKQHNNVE